MNGVPFWRLPRDQFWSDADPEVARPGIRWIQILWIALSACCGAAFNAWGLASGAVSNVFAVNAIFAALSVTIAIFYWPRAINLKNDPELAGSPLRWHIYQLTTQLFWAVLVGLFGTGAAIVAMTVSGISAVSTLMVSISVGLAAYQLFLLIQSAMYLYASTYWLTRS